MAPFRVLSIDGGGIRGVVPAMILADLERRTGRPTCKLFDLIAGTSTGGILALGLVRPKPDGTPWHSAQAMADLYEREGAQIFTRSPVHRIAAMGNLLEEKYSSIGVETVLARHFEDAMLSEALTRVLVTSYDIEMREPYFFKSHRAIRDPRRDHAMREAARATSAAPTYFEPVRIETDDPNGYKALVDGGVYANNPAACALVEAMCEFDAALADVVLLSLGTGELTRPILYEDARTWGVANWAQPILNVVFDGVSDTVNYQVQQLIEKAGGAARYLRIQPTLTAVNDDMDDVGPRNLKLLKLLGERMIAENDARLDAIAKQLTFPPTPRVAPAPNLPESGPAAAPGAA